MSKMSEIHAELIEIGFNKVHVIEAYINKLIRDNKLDITAQEIADDFKVSVNTAIMIIAGAQSNKCSNMLQIEEQESYIENEE